MTHGMLSPRIAWRYLRAPKSHSAVSAIAAISVAGVAVATAAIICVLSVFNGFRELLVEKLDIMAPDVEVTPAKGKVFADADSIAGVIVGLPGVGSVMPTVTDNALVIVDSHEMPVTLKGVVPGKYALNSGVDSILLGGTSVADLTADKVVASVGIARQLGIYETDVPMLVFAPRREGRVNMANPMASFLTDSVKVADIFQAMHSDYDEKTVVCDISLARGLFQYDKEATSFEVSVASGVDPRGVAGEIARALGSSAVVKDRFMQQEISFRMVSIEKWVTFLLLIFILVIASFNIISTLCMLIIEKQQSAATLSAMGMDRRRIGAVFWWESIFVTLAGGLSGLAVGLLLCLAQQQFGIIKFAGDPEALVIPAYPVKVEAADILWAMLPVLAVGLLTASVAAAFARSRATIAK